MTDWKEQLLHKVKATHKRHVLLLDEDFLLEYPTVKRLVQSVFTIVPCAAPLQVRIQFELCFDELEKRFLFVLPAGYCPLPDLEQRAYALEITLNDFFPLFDRALLIGRDEVLLDFLSAQKVYERQSKIKTLDWIKKAALDMGSEQETNGVLRGTTALEVALEKLEGAKTDETSAEFWFDTVQTLAEIRQTMLAHSYPQLEERLTKNITRLNDKFQQFIADKYETLHTRSWIQKPFTVSRVLDHLNVLNCAKTALIVLDGMNFWQWELISEMLLEQKIDIETSATFAFIPSITAFSRQSLLSGGKPNLTQDNSKESQLFRDYWLRNGKQAHQIQYAKFGVNTSILIENLSNSVSVLGLVCNDLDDIMHGTTLGDRQLYNSTRQWLIKSKFTVLIEHLMAAGFTCFITTDHGSLEVKGSGILKQNDKVGVYSRSKRHLNFANKVLLDRFTSQLEASRFGATDLSIYLKDESAFAPENVTLVTHGGSHFWEVLIPFIKIKNEQA